MMQRFFALIVAALLFSHSTPVLAQTYPTRPITLVVPFPPGGGVDALARIVAEKMSRSLGKQIVVENRGGAGGVIATRGVAKVAPDGYTILLAYTGTFAINPSLYSNVGYDPRRDFAPIGLIASQPTVLVVSPALPLKSTAELIAYAKKNPGKINYAYVPGAPGHIATAMFAKTAGIELTNIPYKGNGNALADMFGGHVSMMFLSVQPILGPVKAGTLKALAVTSEARLELLPDVPTIAESGVPGFTAVNRYGLVAPLDTPRGIIDTLNKGLREALAADDLRARLAGDGAIPTPSTPEQYATEIDEDEKRWSPVVKGLNITID